MTFWAPDTGSTTPGSTHPRSELYSQTYFHTAGTHSLNVQCKVLQVTASGKVTIGQIKCFGSGISPNTEALMVIYDNGSIYGRFNTNYDTGTSTAQGYNYYYPATVNIGDPITYQIIESNNMVSLTVNGVTHTDTRHLHGPVSVPICISKPVAIAKITSVILTAALWGLESQFIQSSPNPDVAKYLQ